MTPEQHKRRHQALHAALDELFADYITHHPNQREFTAMPILKLINWSFKQTETPDHQENKIIP